ncbi:MAG: carboxypeptidase-like regulatory domain-containing protein [Planctomycetota bacterium]
MLLALCSCLSILAAPQDIVREQPEPIEVTLRFVTPKGEPLADHAVNYRVGSSHLHENRKRFLTTDADGVVVLQVPPSLLRFEMPEVPKEYFPVRWAGIVGESHHQQSYVITVPTWRWGTVITKDLAGRPITRAGVSVRPPVSRARGQGMNVDPILDGGVWSDQHGKARVRIPNVKGLILQAIHDDFEFLAKGVVSTSKTVFHLHGADAQRRYFYLQDADGRALEGVEFWFLVKLTEGEEEFNTLATGTSLADGWVPVPDKPVDDENDVMLVTGAPGYDYRWKWVEADTEEPQGLVLSKETIIRGKVVDAAGLALKHVPVKTEAPIWMGAIILYHPDFHHLGTTFTDHEGRFEFRGLRDDRTHRMETVGVEPKCHWQGSPEGKLVLLKPGPPIRDSYPFDD